MQATTRPQGKAAAPEAPTRVPSAVPPDPSPGTPSALPSAPASLGQPLPVGGILADSVRSFFANFVPFVVLAMLAMSPLIVWTVIVFWDLDLETLGRRIDEIRWLSFASLGGALVLQTLALGGIVYRVFQGKKGRRPGIGSCLAVGFSRIFPLLGIGAILLVVVFAAVFVAAMLAVAVPLLGLLMALALLIPVLKFLCSAIVAAPVAVVERVGPIRALRRSYKLTNGSRLRIFGVLLVLGIANGMINWLVGTLVQPSPTDLANFIFMLKLSFGVNLGLSVVSAAIMAAASALIYYHLRVNDEGADADQLAAVFD